jgi:hypothetical protein
MSLRSLLPAHPGAAAGLGALAAGIPAWLVGATLLSRRYASLPPDGFRRLAYAGDVFLVVLAAAAVGALALFVVAAARARPGVSARQARATAVWAVLLLPPALAVGAVATTLGAAAGATAAIAGVPGALWVAWDLGRAAGPSRPP